MTSIPLSFSATFLELEAFAFYHFSLFWTHRPIFKAVWIHFFYERIFRKVKGIGIIKINDTSTFPHTNHSFINPPKKLHSSVPGCSSYRPDAAVQPALSAPCIITSFCLVPLSSCLSTWDSILRVEPLGIWDIGD